MSDGKIEIIEGHLLSEDGVAPVMLSAHTMRESPFGIPAIQYTPLDMPQVRNGDMLTFQHAILFCTCGGLEGACGCERMDS